MKLKLYKSNWVKFTSTSWFRLLTIGSNNYVKFTEYNRSGIYIYKNETANNRNNQQNN